MFVLFDSIGSIIRFVAVVSWLVGIWIAKGFFQTFFAVIIPPYAWYIVVDVILTNLKN